MLSTNALEVRPSSNSARSHPQPNFVHSNSLLFILLFKLFIWTGSLLYFLISLCLTLFPTPTSADTCVHSPATIVIPHVHMRELHLDSFSHLLTEISNAHKSVLLKSTVLNDCALLYVISCLLRCSYAIPRIYA
jgi:hypothetical protein